MARLVVGVMVLAGITLSGGLGGHVMREGAREPRTGLASSQTRPKVVPRVAEVPCSTPGQHPEAGCEAVAPAGD